MAVGAALSTTRSLRRSGNEQNDLAAAEVGIVSRASEVLPQRTAIDGLMHLGNFARDRGAARLAENFRALLEGVAHAMRRFIEHQRARFVHQRLETLAPRGASSRKKSLETEAVRGQPADRQRSDGCARSRDRYHVDSRVRCGAHQVEARIADGRCARIADQSDGGTRAQPRNYFARALTFVVIVEGHLGRIDAEMLQQNAGMARVLGRNQGHALQDFARTLRKIVQIADWRRDDVQPPCGVNSHYNLRLFDISGAQGYGSDLTTSTAAAVRGACGFADIGCVQPAEAGAPAGGQARAGAALRYGGQ